MTRLSPSNLQLRSGVCLKFGPLRESFSCGVPGTESAGASAPPSGRPSRCLLVQQQGASPKIEGARDVVRAGNRFLRQQLFTRTCVPTNSRIVFSY